MGFKGFMIQARTGTGPAINGSTAGQKLVGTFLPGPGDKYKTLHCSSPDVRLNKLIPQNALNFFQDTAAHMNNDSDPHVTVLWRAPDPVPDEFSFL